MLKDAEQALCGEHPPPLVRQFQLSNQINLRLVDSKGNSLQSPVFTQQEYKQVNSSESNDTGLSMLRSIAMDLDSEKSQDLHDQGNIVSTQSLVRDYWLAHVLLLRDKQMCQQKLPFWDNSILFGSALSNDKTIKIGRLYI
jgi:hypothetical protein